VFFFVWSWNEFLYPLVLLISNDNQTVPLGLSVMQGQYTSDLTSMSAAALLGVGVRSRTPLTCRKQAGSRLSGVQSAAYSVQVQDLAFGCFRRSDA